MAGTRPTDVRAGGRVLAEREQDRAADPPMTAKPAPGDADAPDPENANALLDEAIEESFPASDPPAMTQPTGPTETPPRPVRKSGLDQAVEGTFPASDPVSPAQPTSNIAAGPTDDAIRIARAASEDPTRRQQEREGLSDEQQPDR